MVPRLLAAICLAAVLAAPPAHTQWPEHEVSGRLHAADLGSPEGALVYFRSGALLDSAYADPDGRFSLSLSRPPEGEIELTVAPTGGPERYYPSRVTLRRGARTTGLALVLVPRRWTIYAGTLAGTVVDVDLRGATAKACGSCSAFYRSVQGDSLPGPPPGIPTWPERAYPLRVAFDRIHGHRITPGDSVVFWRITRGLEEFLGRPLWRPARLEEVLEPVDEDPRGSVLIFVDPSLRSTGLGSSAAQGGDIMASAVHFQRASLWSEPSGTALVSHEMVHALGFGHTCSWRSVVADYDRCRGLSAPAPTPTDVAHIQLLWRIRAMERTLGVSTTISGALAGERVRSQLQPRPQPQLPVAPPVPLPVTVPVVIPQRRIDPVTPPPRDPVPAWTPAG